jgi:hypothetical protein
MQLGRDNFGRVYHCVRNHLIVTMIERHLETLAVLQGQIRIKKGVGRLADARLSDLRLDPLELETLEHRVVTRRESA